jgi:2-polyprenyl-3-methyl-5-hydroxy-6-metoxy-1,4-benzoquinol methylase
MKLTLFDMERKRDALATLLVWNEFKNTYINSPELENENTKEKWDKLNSGKQNLRVKDPMANERIDFVSRVIKDGNKVLDIGFGSGNLEAKLQRVGRNISLTGIDISPRSIANAIKAFKGWKFKVSNVIKHQLPGSNWDVVVALEVFEHLPPSHVLEVYKKVHKSLKYGGLFIISVPLNEGLEAMVHTGRNPNAHTRAYTQNIIKGELILSGFEVIRSKLLYAFHDNYWLKSVIAKCTLGLFHPNNIIVIARKK